MLATESFFKLARRRSQSALPRCEGAHPEAKTRSRWSLATQYSYLIRRNAETADYSQNTQTGWECGDDANYVVYATIPARIIFIIFILKYIINLKSQADIVS